MLTMRRVPRDEMDARHSLARRQRAKVAPERPPQVLNVQQVLDLGNLVYFTFRGRAYGVPPLPYKAGQELMVLWTEAAAFTKLTGANTARYMGLLQRLPRLLWQHTRVVGRIRRWMRRLGLHRNPFLQATEKELVDLASFFLRRRTMSSVQPLPGPHSLGPMT